MENTIAALYKQVSQCVNPTTDQTIEPKRIVKDEQVCHIKELEGKDKAQ